MVMNICRLCDGHCCEGLILVYNSDKSKSPTFLIDLKNDGGKCFIPVRPSKGEMNGWLVNCSVWDKNTGKCKNYENRPSLCRRFVCHEAIKILSLITDFPIVPNRGDKQ